MWQMTGISNCGGLADAVGHDAEIRRLGRAANERRHGKTIGPQPHGVERIGKLLAGRVVWAGCAVLCRIKGTRPA